MWAEPLLLHYDVKEVKLMIQHHINPTISNLWCYAIV